MAAASHAEALVLAAVQDDGRSKAILVTTSVFLAISLVSVGLRCFVRTRIVRAFGWDDSVMLLAMVSEARYHNEWYSADMCDSDIQALNLGFALCGILGAKYGLGRKLAYFGMYPQNLSKALLVCCELDAWSNVQYRSPRS